MMMRDHEQAAVREAALHSTTVEHGHVVKFQENRMQKKLSLRWQTESLSLPARQWFPRCFRMRHLREELESACFPSVGGQRGDGQ